MQFHFEKLEACACVFQSRLIAFVVLGTDPGALLLVRRVWLQLTTLAIPKSQWRNVAKAFRSHLRPFLL